MGCKQGLRQLRRDTVAERQAAEAARKEVLRCARQADVQAEEATQLGDWLSANGHAGVNSRKTKLLKARFWYPLHAAVRQLDSTMVTLLIRAGADVQQKDSSHRTPLE